jgi:hypothetical protein
MDFKNQEIEKQNEKEALPFDELRAKRLEARERNRVNMRKKEKAPSLM